MIFFNKRMHNICFIFNCLLISARLAILACPLATSKYAACVTSSIGNTFNAMLHWATWQSLSGTNQAKGESREEKKNRTQHGTVGCGTIAIAKRTRRELWLGSASLSHLRSSHALAMQLPLHFTVLTSGGTVTVAAVVGDSALNVIKPFVDGIAVDDNFSFFHRRITRTSELIYYTFISDFTCVRRRTRSLYLWVIMQVTKSARAHLRIHTWLMATMAPRRVSIFEFDARMFTSFSVSSAIDKSELKRRKSKTANA